jgi:hypothetical protein
MLNNTTALDVAASWAVFAQTNFRQIPNSWLFRELNRLCINALRRWHGRGYEVNRTTWRIKMHQMAFPLKLGSARLNPVQKRTVEDEDLQIVADLVCEGLSEGLYKDIVPGRRRSDVLRFLRHLVTKSEIKSDERSEKHSRRRTAALFVYSVQGAVVGFSVLGQVLSKSIEGRLFFPHDPDYAGGTDADHLPMIPGDGFNPDPDHSDKLPRQKPALGEPDRTGIENAVELLMLGVVPRYRELRFGAFILDSLTKAVSGLEFNLIVRCPSDNQLLFAMLMMRGFFAVSRYCRGRILLFSASPPHQ